MFMSWGGGLICRWDDGGSESLLAVVIRLAILSYLKTDFENKERQLKNRDSVVIRCKSGSCDRCGSSKAARGLPRLSP